MSRLELAKRVFIKEDHHALSFATARYLIEAINQDPYLSVALPWGHTPIETYEILGKAYRRNRVNPRNVTIFALDDYVGVRPKDPRSGTYFLRKNVIRPLDIKPGNFHYLDGSTRNPEKYCEEFKAKLEKMGIDWTVLGIGPGTPVEGMPGTYDDHIGFNMPGSRFDSRTRVVDLLDTTRKANAGSFGDDYRNVPAQAMTMGIGDFLEARQGVMLLMSGTRKAGGAQRAIEEPVTEKCPASAVQRSRNPVYILDREAASQLHSRLYVSD